MTRAMPSLLAVGLLAAACSNSPIRYIPESDRDMLQTQERLGTGEGKAGGPITVDQMLRGVKAASAAPQAATPASGRVLLRFDGDSVQPDDAQRATLRRFAAGAAAASLTVSTRPGEFDDPGAPVLGQRRAIAVSRELAGLVPDVEMRFDAALPPDVVVVSREGAAPAGNVTP